VAFDRAFASLSAERCWQEEPGYYPPYRTRYEAILQRFADHAPEVQLGVLDIGGVNSPISPWRYGRTMAPWPTDTTAIAGLRSLGLNPFQWNVALDDAPTERRFGAIFSPR
jgi:hypothetical protein